MRLCEIECEIVSVCDCVAMREVYGLMCVYRAYNTKDTLFLSQLLLTLNCALLSPITQTTFVTQTIFVPQSFSRCLSNTHTHTHACPHTHSFTNTPQHRRGCQHGACGCDAGLWAATDWSRNQPGHVLAVWPACCVSAGVPR